tara:strand:- start:1862 stop:2140 length:279 start_codon:yes stop_codon:yes gene_type:complete
MNRSQRRAIEKKMGKAAAKNLSEKISQFSQLPEACNTCQKEFDKKNKTMVQSWSVVVRQEVVRLFCPDCIKKTQEILDASTETFDRRTRDDS